MKIATAPGTWGVEPPPGPEDPPWTRILTEIASAGFDGTELGPYGYYPTEPSALQAALDERGLQLPAGFLMEPLSDPREQGRVLEGARRTCSLVAGVGGRCLVVIDALSADRSAVAGRSDGARRLDEQRWGRLVDTVDEICRIARQWGLAAAFHPHAGTHVEFVDEVDRLLSDSSEGVMLCLDTGHAVYAGCDPVAVAKRHAARLAHVHLKDVDERRLSEVLAQGMSFERAVEEKVFTPLGHGSVDLPAFAAVLQAEGYQGWATFEQDRVLTTIDQALPDAKTSLQHARASGFCSASAPARARHCEKGRTS